LEEYVPMFLLRSLLYKLDKMSHPPVQANHRIHIDAKSFLQMMLYFVSILTQASLLFKPLLVVSN